MTRPNARFQADPFVDRLLDWKPSATTTTTSVSENHVEFGLVLNTGWPQMGDWLEEPYHTLVSCCMPQCFDDERDIRDQLVYFYPKECLHVTVATLHAFHHQTKDPTQRKTLLRHWRAVVQQASQHPDWPNNNNNNNNNNNHNNNKDSSSSSSSLRLKYKGAHIGSKAGILLWEETTGRLERMRWILRNQVDLSRAVLQDVGIHVGTVQIPNIVHTTFLRFRRVPHTPRSVVQERFRNLVLPRLPQLFGGGDSQQQQELVLEDAKLVNEQTPYMHIPMDKEHVIEVFSFG